MTAWTARPDQGRRVTAPMAQSRGSAVSRPTTCSSTYVKSTALVVAALLLLSGCGNGSNSNPTAGSSHPSSHPTHQSGPTAAQVAACKRAVGPLLRAESQVDDRLNVGIQFSDYTSRLGDISVAYSHAVTALKAGVIPQSCINRVGLPLQRAFNDYRAAGNVWNHCITDYSCRFDHGSPALKKAQAKWSAASVALDDARSNLASMHSAN
jgi:hypothetical protein